MRRRELLVPAAFYLGVMVVAPGLRGAAREEEFWLHAGITVGVTLLVVIARSSWTALARARRRR